LKIYNYLEDDDAVIEYAVIEKSRYGQSSRVMTKIGQIILKKLDTSDITDK
jgi:hypothetical protein